MCYVVVVCGVFDAVGWLVLDFLWVLFVFLFVFGFCLFGGVEGFCFHFCVCSFFVLFVFFTFCFVTFLQR